MAVNDLIDFFEQLTPSSVARFPEFYSADAYFKDPVNEVHGVAAIQRIFTHMFTQVGEPRFVVTGKVADADGVLLIWEFRCLIRVWGRKRPQMMRGVSHLKFDAQGRVNYHRDYWDAAEELYMKLPLVSALMRGLRRLMAAT